MSRFAALLVLTFVSENVRSQTWDRQAVIARNGMVVAVCPIATQVGVDVLKAGGNAVDAAVAVGFAEAVTWPEAGNIGGGGFMLVWPQAGEPTCFDYRETAPALATRDMFTDGTDWRSPKSAGVPGTVRGLALAHSRFGKLRWKDLVMPAVTLAENGFMVDASLAGRLNNVLGDGKSLNPEFLRVYGKSTKWAAGDTLKLPELAKTLRGIAEQGPEYFYTGPAADLLEAEMLALGGLIRKGDLAKYQARERKPIRGTYRGYDIAGAPPPSSGGITLLLALNMLEQFDVAKHPRRSAQTVHLLAEVQRRAYLERARHLGDPDFTKIPAELTTKAYARKLAETIDLTKATKSHTLAPELEIREGSDTTHFSIIDKDGMAVANTYTLENSFGNRIVVRGAGYILNNEMTDFNTQPGVTNTAGKIGTPANDIVPGKRMLSSMCPVIVSRDGKPFLITGSPGGRTIINTVLGITINVLDYSMDVQAAVNEPRQHHQWFPDRIMLERMKDDPARIAELQKMGHEVRQHKQGDGHTIWIDPKTGLYHGAADPRLNGKALGY